MSTAGLRKVGNYEQTLAAAIKDKQHVAGVINPFLANAATRIINSVEFQRVKDRLEDDLTQQTKNHMDQQRFEHNVTNLAVDARINRSDLDYIVNNLQQPPPPPAPPPPPNDAAADRARLIAELDGMAMERERQSRQEMMAQRNAMDLAAQQVATPAQQIVREFHHVQQPIYIPTPQIPVQENHNEMMRQMGLTMQQIFLQQQGPIQGGYRPPPEEIPIVYNNQGPPPGAPPGAGRVARSGYGPARIARERYTPFQGGGPPPFQGGATSPMPIRPRPLPAPPAQAPQPVPNRFPGRGQKLPDEPRFVPFSGQGQKLPDEPAAVRPPKRKGDDDRIATKKPKKSRFPGQGNKLPDEPRFTPFSGQAQRLPGEGSQGNLRANAIQRMRELGHQGEQRGRAREMVDRQADMGRALRRGGARGDVQDLGKRKRDQEFVPNPRPAMRRMGDRPSGPQQFDIAR